MSYKSILTVLTRAADAPLAVGAAARLAQTLDAHLDILVLGWTARRWAIPTSDQGPS